MAVVTELRDEYHSLLESAANGTSLSIETAELASVTEKDTLFVIDMQEDFLPGGAFGVAEGDHVIDGICELIEKFNKAGATVIATRELHPINHCSFMSEGGPFPAHCVNGTKGSLLHPKIAGALQPLLKAQAGKSERETTHVVYKGFSKDIDSFGGLQYDESTDHWRDRVSHNPTCDHGSGHLEWTGAYALPSANIIHDANAPPDVMSVFEKRPVSDLLPHNTEGERVGRVFVCGLAYDFCVLDTALNYCGYRGDGHNDGAPHCFIVQDLTRAAHIPGFGKFGTGFITDPEVLHGKLVKANVGLVRFA